MRGTQVTDPGSPLPGPAGDGWALAYAGDFSGDGMADLLWYNADEAASRCG